MRPSSTPSYEMVHAMLARVLMPGQDFLLMHVIVAAAAGDEQRANRLAHRSEAWPAARNSDEMANKRTSRFMFI